MSGGLDLHTPHWVLLNLSIVNLIKFNFFIFSVIVLDMAGLP